MNYLPETPDLRGDAHRIVNRAIRDALPDAAVRATLAALALPDRLMLASPASDYISGQTIYIDGGWQACL